MRSENEQELLYSVSYAEKLTLQKRCAELFFFRLEISLLDLLITAPGLLNNTVWSYRNRQSHLEYSWLDKSKIKNRLN